MTFLAPLFLIAAAAGAIPVLLHMINRQKAKEVPFSTLRFLQISVQKTRRRQRLHDVVLMILRAGVLVLIALGLASPTLTELPSFFGGGRNAAVAIILDNSASMGTIDEGRPRFETAKQAAAQILERLADGDQVALFVTGGPSFPEQGRLDRTHDRARQMLAAAAVSHERADLGEKLLEARRILADAEAGNKEIFVITDMQRLSWEGLAKPQAAEEKTDEEKIPIIVVDCNRAPKPNVAVTDVRLDAPVPVARLPINVSVEIFNSSTVAQKRRLELFIDGTRRATGAETDIPAEGTAREDFQFVFDSGGLHRGEVKLAGDDGCPLDDSRWFAVEIDRGIPVAVVKNRQHEIAYLDDSFYLEQALSAGPAGGKKAAGGAIKVTDLTAADLAGEPLSQYKIVFCVNLPAPSPEAAERLAQYVDGGGNLFWIAGDETEPEALNRADEACGGRLLPGRLGEVLAAADSPHNDGTARDSWHIAQLDKDYPPFERLLEPASLYSSVLVYKRVEVQDDSKKTFRVLARLDDGKPLFLERNVGRGRVLLLGTSLNTAWTNLPLRPIFLPLLLRTVFELAGVRQGSRQAIAGAPLLVQFAGRQEPVGVEIVPPSGETIRRKTIRSDTGQVFRYGDTHTPGIYLLRQLDGGAMETGAEKPGTAGTIAFAVNGDPEESQSTTIAHENLKEQLGAGVVIFADNPGDLSATFDLLSHGRGLWQAFLYAVLAGLVFETFLSNRFSPKDAPA